CKHDLCEFLARADSAMHRADEQVADRVRSRPAPMRSDLSLAAEPQAGATWSADGALSVRVLTAQGDGQDATVLNVNGEIDLGTAPVLREVLLPVLEHGTGPVIVDLSEVPFMDSTGVHVLVDALQRLTPQNRRFAIACREGGQVHRLLALVGLLDALTVHRSRESAVIGGGGRLRAEPCRTSRPSEARAPTESPASTRRVNDQPTAGSSPLKDRTFRPAVRPPQT
ncbi:MAG: STAS domain-containing protein, partial [Solirubrobacteraceae bacterium]